ncbi:hypothetical protein EII25_03005 [Erysipelotrichaceae bacterium OH741_COT-311]|nr:hypothetical protein EII25_03005 [Erysipelotrichaceae bacterium OH741_COT-311]
MIKWRFPSNDYGENKGINDSGIATFRGTPLKSLAREICQNSLDATKGEIVKVDFNVFSISTANIPGMPYLKDVFQRCLDFWEMQKSITTKEFYTNALVAAQKEDCVFLRISDFNTVGLTGVYKEINTNWTNLTKSSGLSDKKGTAGGSYGIGKFAPFACSDFSTVFYSTYNIDEEEAYQGVARLVTFKRYEDEQTTQGIGYFGNEKNTPVYDQLSIDPDYKRTRGEYGTDIYIAGYKFANGDWQKDIIVSVLDGFLGAIWNNKLMLNVGDKLVSKETLADLIEIYRDDLIDYTEQYFKVLISDKTHWIEKDFMGLGNIRFGILIGEPDSPRKVAMIRKTGMKIMDRNHLPGHVPCVGIMFIEGDKINEKLRVMENPEHTKWQPDRAKNPIRARELIKSLNRFINETIEKFISVGGGDEIDAVGVGMFLPDVSDNQQDKSKEEVVGDKIVEVELKVVPKRTRAGDKSGFNKVKDNDLTIEGEKEPEGDEREWFHNEGHTKNPGYKNPQPAHTVDGSNDAGNPSKKNVSLKKFVSICVNKSKGQYLFMLTPNENVNDVSIEVYLSGETQNYEACIKNAVITLGYGKVSIFGNTISGIKFEKDKTLRMKVELDFYNLCAMEVKAYATEK